MASVKTLKKARKLCRFYQVNFRFTKSFQCYSYPWLNFIHLCKDLNDIELISGLFHEIQHVLNWRNKKYVKYHSGNMSKRDFKRWALPAEIYTDKQAEKLAKAWGFKKFIRTYANTPKHKEFLMEFYEKYAS